MCSYSPQEQQQLFQVARAALRVAVRQAAPGPLPFSLDSSRLPPALLEARACFVTLLTYPDHTLRGCTGSLLARLPLAEEVAYSTQNTALNDPRFPPVSPAEEAQLQIEISVLSPPRPLPYQDAADLLDKLEAHRHGVTLRYAGQAATFLPQVWAKLPDKQQFLAQLCRKMGLPPQAWQSGHLRVEVYQSESLHEPR